MRADRKIQNRAIQRFVKNNTRKNKARNVILVIAVVLVTILMTVMFGAGISIFHNFQLANLRTAGTKANGGLYMATEKEMEQISALDEVEATGKQQFVGEVLDVKGMPSQTIISMTAYDETEWENFIKPTVSDITGNYPRQESEVMLSRWTLEKLGVDDPQIGMTISVKYKLLSGEEKQQEFTLSGYYTDFIYETGVTPNSGNTMAANLYFINHSMSKRAAGNMIVSSRFAEEHGKEEGGLGTFLIDDRLNAEEALALLDHAAGNDEIFVSGLSGTAAQALMGAMIPILAVIFVMISGYLLIYNIINISVLQEMHMYGQLKALGATSKQLKKIVRKQVNLVAAVGIILGLLFGTAFAVITVPKFLEALMNSQNGKFEFGITVSPLIYVFTVLFAYMTVWFSARKGMRLAGKVSPTEALKYVDVVHKIKGHKGSGGGKLYRMAYRNVFRSRKRALVTFASLFFGLLIYLTVSSSTQKLDYNLKYDREMPYDFVMEDISWQLGNEEKAEKSLDDGILEKVKNLEGVDKIETDYVEVTKVEEAEGLVMSTSLGDPDEWIIKTQGKPISKADKIKIIDENGQEVAKGKSGELIVRGVYTIESYYNEPKADIKFTEDGYYKTGDRALITEEGNICVLGRIQEQINRAGEKIQPSEIEEGLLELEEIQQVVVVAIADHLLGQKSCAFVQFKEGKKLDKNEICNKLQQKGIVHYKIPDQIEFIEEWPKTKIGKIDINRLREKVTIK